MHSAKLESMMREYIAIRLQTQAKLVSPVVAPDEAPPLPLLTLGDTAESGREDAITSAPTQAGADLPTPVPDGAGGQVVPPFPEQADNQQPKGNAADETTTQDGDVAAEQSAVDADPRIDGGGDVEADIVAEGEIVEVEQVIEGRKAFPSVSPDRPEADVLPPQAIHHDSPPPAPSTAKEPEVWRLLPEIARLAREMVKNGEEKVAVAQGAYNSVSYRPTSIIQLTDSGQIDRHIRALDSALSTQEASILLGLRPNTAPSALVGDDLNLVADTGAVGGEGDLEIGVGGGGPKRKGRASRGGKRKGRGGASAAATEAAGSDSQAVAVLGAFGDAAVIFEDVDP